MPGSGRPWPARSAARRSNSRRALRLPPPSVHSSPRTRTRPFALVELRPGRLAAGQVDAELLGSPEHVLVGLPHLDLLALRGENLHVEGQGLHLLDEDLEGLRDARL